MISSSRAKLLPLLLFLPLLACASAGKRYEQGLELEMQGQYESATARYAQALEKDPEYTDARVKLREAGEMAIAQRLEDAEHWESRHEPVTVAHQYRRVDTVLARAKSVGVRLELPDDYEIRRRDAFDGAVTSLLEFGDVARRQGHWHEGVDAYRRARQDFEPDGEQRTRSLEAEAGLLVDWSEEEYATGNLRSSFEVASRVHELEWSPDEEMDRATSLMEMALDEGEVELLVLPIASTERVLLNRRGQDALLREIDVALQVGPWRQSPAFIAVHDPLAVRDLVNHTGLLDGEYKPAAMAMLLRLTESDYGARLLLTRSEETEHDVRSTTRSVKTRDGRSTTFVQEDGMRRLQVEARVLVVDNFGNVITDTAVSGMGTAPFSRGVYDGKPQELNLSGSQVDLFDRFAQQSQQRAVHQALAADLALKLADAVYFPVLAQIP